MDLGSLAAADAEDETPLVDEAPGFGDMLLLVASLMPLPDAPATFEDLIAEVAGFVATAGVDAREQKELTSSKVALEAEEIDL